MAGISDNDIITLSHGNGGMEMNELVKLIRGVLGIPKRWHNCLNDSAVSSFASGCSIAFTTDSYTVKPLFFPDADIGYLAVCGTVNDLAVAKAKPVGISLSLIIEEGFSMNMLKKILLSCKRAADEAGVEIVTGDTKVVEKNSIDKIMINTSGIGILAEDNNLADAVARDNNVANNVINNIVNQGDVVLASGSIGEHSIALLSKRLGFSTNIVSDVKPVLAEISSLMDLKVGLKFAKDLTRGGLASALNETAAKFGFDISVDEKQIPVKKEVARLCNVLGFKPYELACEGRFIAVVAKESSSKALNALKQFNKDAKIIGFIANKSDNPKVILKTDISETIMRMPYGRLIPRIC